MKLLQYAFAQSSAFLQQLQIYSPTRDSNDDKYDNDGDGDDDDKQGCD